MLLKDDQERPTTSNIMDLPFFEKYVTEFVKTNGNASRRDPGFERQATATAQLQLGEMPIAHKKPEKEEIKKKPLTVKERLKLKKEEEVNKRTNEINEATKAAHALMAE